MKRPPKLCHHKASGRAVVRINGKDHYCGAWDTRRDRPTPAALATYHRILAEIAVRGSCTTRMRSLGELVDAYYKGHVLTAYRKHGRHTSEVSAQKVALRFLSPWCDLPVDEFGPLRLKVVRQAMIEAGLFRRSINRHIGRIRQAFAWAAENELIAPEISARLQCVRGLRTGSGGKESPGRGPVAWELVEAVRPFVSPAVWAMAELQYLTGMRSGEVVIMRGCDIDMTGDVWFYRPSRHKTEHRGYSRIVAIGPKARAILASWLRANPQEFIFRPDEAPKRRGAAGPHYTHNSYRRALQRGQEAEAREAWQGREGDEAAFQRFLKERRWVPHQLRHSFATRARAIIGELDPIRAALGHAGINVTLEYAALDMGKAADVARLMG